MPRENQKIGVGPTVALNLRVSVGALARVVADDPENGQTLLVLERAATLQEGQDRPAVVVTAKPFGGALRLRDVGPLQAAIGEFQFDSPRSRQEADFRILIREEDWPRVQAFCLSHLRREEDGALEASPERELVEEFHNSLKISVPPEQAWTLTPLDVVIEARPAPTDSPRAPGLSTVRIYNVYEVRLNSPEVIAAVLENSAAISDEHLGELALADRRRGGRGRANAVLTVPLEPLVAAYRATSVEARGSPVRIGGHLLTDNVPAILPEVETLKYSRLDLRGF
jgi:hypothetical protein